MTTQTGGTTNHTALLWKKAKRLGLNTIKGLTLDDIETPVSDTEGSALEVEGEHVVTGGEEWIPTDPTAIINKDRPDENHPKLGWRPKEKKFRWCTDMHRKKAGLQHWKPVSKKEHPELEPIDHPLTSANDGAQDQIRMNDAFLCEAPAEEINKRKRYYEMQDERRVNRRLYESHKTAQREGGGPGIIFKTGKVAHGTVGSSPIAKKKMVSVPAQIK